MADNRFEEKIIYKTRQHWIVLVVKSLKLILSIALPAGLLGFLLSGLVFTWGIIVFLVAAVIVIAYDHYLWHHSWLFIGNQKVTLSVRNGLFSQYAMNIRYRNIRDSAVSKNSMLGFLLKYGSLFVRSSANEGDFQAHFVPKVGKAYALINALSRYSDDERAEIHSIDQLYSYHKEQEFTPKNQSATMTVEEAMFHLKNMAGVIEVVELVPDSRKYILAHEEVRNRGVAETLSREHVLVLLHNSEFRSPAAPIVETTAKNEVYFPGVPFPEVSGKRVISASPSAQIHQYLLQFFPYNENEDATVLVGWDA